MASLNAIAPIGIVLGAMLGLGLWLIVSAVPRVGRPRLVERVAPYVADLSAEARAMLARRPSDPAPVLGMVITPLAQSAPIRSPRAGSGGNDVIARRLRQAGSTATVERFRGEQLAWAAAGFVAGAALALAAPDVHGPADRSSGWRSRSIAAALGAVLRDWMLQRRARRRLARISAELPTVLEFLTLSLTAGEGMLDAIRRVARAGSGELPTEFARVVAAVGTGVPLAAALADLRDGLDHPALSRALDQVLGALERGAPLAAVLRVAGGRRTRTRRSARSSSSPVARRSRCSSR